MTLEQRIEAMYREALERFHRSLGQLARYAHRDVLVAIAIVRARKD